MKFAYLFCFLICLGFTTKDHFFHDEHYACKHEHASFAEFAESHKLDTTYYDLFPTLPRELYDSIFYFNQDFICDGFDYPVGKPNAENYYLARRFGEKNHLGEDWNGRGGGNTDLGDPVYAVADGLVTFSRNVCCGWGNVVRVVHLIPINRQYNYVESLYAHMHNLDVRPGQLIRRGDRIGTIGTADGAYTAHLHLEVRDFINMSLGPGYSDNQFGYVDPSQFISKNRP